MCFRNTFQKAAAALNNHGVIALPTETVMGLAVAYDDLVAYEKLNKIKEREATKPYSLMCLKQDIEKYAYINEKAAKLIDKFLPGPLTLLLKAKESLPGHVTHNTGVVGIRVSSQEEVTKLLIELNKPILVPSANRAGRPPMMNSNQVKKGFGKEIDYIIKGACFLNSSSTIVDCTGDKIKVLRCGPIMEEEIKEVLKSKL